MNSRILSLSAACAAVLALQHRGPAAQELGDSAVNEGLFAAADIEPADRDLPDSDSGNIASDLPEPGRPELGELGDADESGRIEPDEALTAPAASAAPQPRFRFSGRLRTVAVADDNIFIQEKKVSDFIFSVQPGFTFGYGDTLNRKENFLLFEYDANASFFMEHREENSLDHDAALRAQWHGSKVTLGSFLRFRSLHDINIELGDRLRRDVYEGGIYGCYELSDRTRLRSGINLTRTNYERGYDYTELNNPNWIDHDLGPRTTAGVGVTLGTLDVQESGRQTYQQLLGRLRYSVASRVEVEASAGVEFRQVERGSSQATPVFNVGATYTPYELLTLRAGAYRRVQPSIAFAGQNTTVTGLSAGAEYRFAHRWQASAVAGYERAEYRPSRKSGSTDRKDDYAYGRIGLDYSMTRNWRLGAFYSYRTNDSTRDGSSFDNQQVGIQSSVAF